MLFNSIDFAVFLPLVFVGYWFVFHRNLKVQNFFVVVVSYVFYGWWDWRFLGLLFLSSLVDYYVGLGLPVAKSPLKRKVLLWISLGFNLGLLGFFKYYNFFIDSFIGAFTFMGYPMEARSLNIILPVGISFYSFQTLSYSLDIYLGKLKPTRQFISFLAFVSFFPQLVAGPIERAINLLPQFYQKRQFDPVQARDGLRQILWGFFKKVVIADNAARHVNQIFDHYDSLPGSLLLLGLVYFAFQIYGDFSGYSDIAIGTGRLFGFRLMRNFAYPYFSRDIAEFWRRWHISLSTWFRDYLYFPLGGSRMGKSRVLVNTLILFVVSGFWHGANWTFVVWGALNALFFVPLLLTNRNRVHLEVVAHDRLFPPIRDLLKIALTFFLTLLAWTFFRAPSVEVAFHYLSCLFSESLFVIPNKLEVFPFILLLVGMEYIQRRKQHGLEIDHWPVFARWSTYSALLFLISMFGDFHKTEFIYFQF